MNTTLRAFVVLVAALTAAPAFAVDDPDGPNGWYVGDDDKPWTHQDTKDDCERARDAQNRRIEIETRIDPKRASQKKFECVYMGDYWLIADFEGASWAPVIHQPFKRWEECHKALEENRDSPAVKRDYFCTRLYPFRK